MINCACIPNDVDTGCKFQSDVNNQGSQGALNNWSLSAKTIKLFRPKQRTETIMCAYELLSERNLVASNYSIIIIHFTINLTSYKPHGTQYYFRLPYIWMANFRILKLHI